MNATSTKQGFTVRQLLADGSTKRVRVSVYTTRAAAEQKRDELARLNPGRVYVVA